MFNVFDSSMRFRGELEGVTSAQWGDNWDSVGTISLTAALTPHNDSLLQVGGMIEVGYLANAPGAEKEMPPYILCNLQRSAKNGTILADGKTADYILHRRNASLPKFEGVTIDAAAMSVVADNLRGLPVDVGSFPGDAREDAMPDITLESGALDDLALQILAFGGYGRQLRRQGNRLNWAVDPGRDKRHTPEIPVFADENGSASGSVLGDDDSLTCNVATSVLHFSDKVPDLAPDEEHQEDYEEGRTERFSIGQTEAEGLARRELWCGDFFQERDETAEEFRARAQAAMEQSMQEHVRVLNLSAAIDPRDYGTLYRTGDLLRARAGSIRLERRVTAVNWVYDGGGTQCTLRLGPPTKNVLRQFKERKPLSSAVSGGIAGALAAAGSANKKIIDLHRKWLAMIIAIGDVSAGLDAAIQNFDEYKEAAAEVFAQVDENAAGIAAIAADDVLEQLRQAKTTMYAKVLDDIDGCVKQAYLELYAVSDGQGNSKTFADLVADVISALARVIDLEGKVKIDGSLFVSNGIIVADAVSSFRKLLNAVAGIRATDINLTDGIRFNDEDWVYRPVTIPFIRSVSSRAATAAYSVKEGSDWIDYGTVTLGRNQRLYSADGNSRYIITDAGGANYTTDSATIIGRADPATGSTVALAQTELQLEQNFAFDIEED